MAEFYTWPRSACYFLSLIIALCVLAQTLAVMVSVYRHPRSRGRVFEMILELFILGHVFACSLLHAQAMLGYDMSLFTPSEYGVSRIVFFAAIALLALLVTAETRKPQAFIALAVAGLTLPLIERLEGRLFAWLYVAAMLFWLARSIVITLSRYREIRTTLSALSIKSAMDSLNTAVMFCESGGFIVLCNRQMQRLMTVITGGIRRNGELFFRLLASEEINPECKITWFEGENACLLPDGTVWLFARADLAIRGKKYTQFTASNITERWKLTATLQGQNEELRQRQEELVETLGNLQTLSHERETQKARMRAHDILGGRLTLLLRTIRSAPVPDYELLRSLTAGLMDELKAAENEHSPQDDMDILKQTFESIGVGILFDGELPPDREKGQLFIGIAKEAVTNAVRHGYATKVFIAMELAEGCRRMRVSDNGGLPVGAIKEGGGISGMRHRLAAFGGALSVATRPGFTLTIDVPEDEKDV